MKALAIGSILALFAIATTVSAPLVFADHSEATVSIPSGASAPGCEETNECYVPAEVTIDVGGEVTWSNDDSAAHTVTSGTPEDGPDGNFDSSLFMAGTTYSVKFDGYEPGDYPYFCMVHPWMIGVVTVAGEDQGEETPAMAEPTATGMLSDGTAVNIWTSEPTAGTPMEITVKFEDSEHVNYDIVATQNGNNVLEDIGTHKHDGMGEHYTAALDSADPIDITITFQGYGVDDPKTGPIGEQVVFSNVVPEFGTIAMIVLGVAIMSIIAVSAKSKIIPRM